jgi:hypothetical protein
MRLGNYENWSFPLMAKRCIEAIISKRGDERSMRELQSASGSHPGQRRRDAARPRYEVNCTRRKRSRRSNSLPTSFTSNCQWALANGQII